MHSLTAPHTSSAKSNGGNGAIPTDSRHHKKRQGAIFSNLDPHAAHTSFHDRNSSIVKYLIASEFDVNLGPVIKEQYPHPIPGDLPYFAELLLPDQIHNRQEDWTVVILHKNKLTNQYQYGSYDGDNRLSGNESTSVGKDGNDQPLYILNVVNTRFDQNVHRCTVIKGIAIATGCQYFQIFKPLLLFALDHLFQVSSSDTRSIRSILQNLYHSIHDLNVATAIPALPFGTKLLINSIIDFPIKDYCSNQTFVTRLLESSLSDTRNPSQNNKTPFAHGVLGSCTVKNNGNLEISVNYSNFKIPLRIPLLQLPDVVGDFSIKDFLTKFLACVVSAPVEVSSPSKKTKLNSLPNASSSPACQFPELMIYGNSTPAIIVLINAFLTHKRIFYLGNKKSAHEICEYVFATIALISGGGLLTGFLGKTFPYIDLSKFDFIESQKWFFAGTANPTFKLHDELWDVLYEMELNQLILSTHSSSTAHEDPSSQATTPSLNPANRLLSSPFDSRRLSENLIFLPFNETADNEELQQLNEEDNEDVQSPLSPTSSGLLFILQGSNSNKANNSNVPKPPNNSIITEDALFLKKLNILIDEKHDDDTILIIFRQHINNIMRILISEKLYLDQYQATSFTPLSPSFSISRSGSLARRSSSDNNNINGALSHASFSYNQHSKRTSSGTSSGTTSRHSKSDINNFKSHSKDGSMNSSSSNATFSATCDSKHSSMTTNASTPLYNYKYHYAKADNDPDSVFENFNNTKAAPVSNHIISNYDKVYKNSGLQINNSRSSEPASNPYPFGTGVGYTGYKNGTNNRTSRPSSLSINTSVASHLKNHNSVIVQSDHYAKESGYFWSSKTEKLIELKTYYQVYKAYVQGYSGNVAEILPASITRASPQSSTVTINQSQTNQLGKLPANPIIYYFDICQREAQRNNDKWTDICYQLSSLQNSTNVLPNAKATELLRALLDYVSTKSSSSDAKNNHKNTSNESFHPSSPLSSSSMDVPSSPLSTSSSLPSPSSEIIISPEESANDNQELNSKNSSKPSKNNDFKIDPVENFLLCSYLLPSKFDNEFSLGKNAGIEMICLALYHRDTTVRELAAKILVEVQNNFVGRIMLKSTLNPFFKLALEDQLQCTKAPSPSQPPRPKYHHPYQQQKQRPYMSMGSSSGNVTVSYSVMNAGNGSSSHNKIPMMHKQKVSRSRADSGNSAQSNNGGLYQQYLNCSHSGFGGFH